MTHIINKLEIEIVKNKNKSLILVLSQMMLDYSLRNRK